MSSISGDQLRTTSATLSVAAGELLAIADICDQQNETIIDQRETIEALQARVAELEANQPQPPAEPISIVARVNAYANASWASRLGCHIITDVSVNANDVPNFNQFLAAYPRPAAGFGTYLSGQDVLDRPFTKYPAETIAGAQIPIAWKLPGGYPNDPQRFSVNITLQDAAVHFATLITDVFRERTFHGFNVLYLDNIAHPASGDRRFTWAQRCWFLEYVKGHLPPNTRLFVNVTLPPGMWPNPDLVRLTQVCHGVTFEHALHPTYRTDATKVQSAIADVREFARHGLTVIFCPYQQSGWWTTADYERERQFAAGLALFCREQADAPIFGTAGSQPPPDGINGKVAPDWFTWAERLGQPQSESIAHPTYSRTFDNGTLILDAAAGTARVELD